MGVITISREFGSGGETVSRLVAEKTGFLLVNKSMILKELTSYGLEKSELNIIDENLPNITRDFAGTALISDRYISALHEYLYDLAIRESLVILGRGAQILFHDFPPALHVKIISPLQQRTSRIARLYKLQRTVALKLIAEQDESRKKYILQLFNKNWLNPDLYNLIINTGVISLENAADIVVKAFQIHAEPKETSLEDDDQLPPEENLMLFTEKKPSFMHPSEEEFANMLDFYNIKWDYEPKTFPLQWDSEGNVTSAFSPDFYLPEQQLYIELTTQKQKLVWKKNKKIRRLKELYPNIKIKILYNKDYQSLLQKFGLDEDEDNSNGNGNDF